MRKRKWKKPSPGSKTARPEYPIWNMMKARCNNPKAQVYAYYGARGIRVCKRWENSFEAFVEDMGPRPEGMTLDRENNDGHYRPGISRRRSEQRVAG